MKGQSQVVGFTVITLIMLSITSIVFLWAQPLIDRAVDFNNIDRMENQIIKLDNAIREVAYDKSQKKINLQIDMGNLIWESNNSINYYSNQDLPFSSGEKILVSGSFVGPDNTIATSPCYNTSINGSIGIDKSSCIYKQGSNFEIFYPVLNDSSGDCFAIRVVAGNNAGTGSGNHEIELKYNRTVTTPYSLDNGCSTIYKPEVIFNIK